MMEGLQLWSAPVWCVYVMLLLMGAESSNRDESVTIYNEEGRIRGFRTSSNASDFHIGLLVSVYLSESQGHCNYTFASRGVELAEAFLFCIDALNSQQNLLPNVTLGFDIRDYCESEVLAVNETLDWIQYSEVLEAYSMREQFEANSKFVGVVGTEYSVFSIPVASFLRVFSFPQVSYISTSPVLSNKYLYPYFLRTVPSDTAQAQAMIDIVNNFGWEVVSTVNSGEPYGEQGIKVFRDLASTSGVCIDIDIQIELYAPDREITELASRLVVESVAEVVVVFSIEQPMIRLLERIKMLNITRRFTWVASDGISFPTTIQETFPDMVTGMFSVFPLSPIYPNFDEYFSDLNTSNNVRDPWFNQYYNQVLRDSESFQYSQGLAIPLLVDAVYSIAHGLDEFLKENCDQPLIWNRTSQACNGQMQELTGSILYEYIKNVTFLSPTNTTVSFDNNGDGEPVYTIFNMQYSGSSVNNIQVGKWDVVNRLMFSSPLSDLQFGITPGGQIVKNRQSECSSCVEGSAQVEVPASCCTYCTPCLGNTYLNTSYPNTCTDCGELMWGNNPLIGSTACVPITQDYLKVEDALGIVIIILGTIGILLLIAVCTGVAIFWKNFVMKSFGREQMVLLLIGLTFCFLSPYLFFFSPSPTVCALQQIGLCFSITLILAALLVKLIRVTRIFLSPATGGKLRFIAPWQQVVFTLVIVSVQMILVVIQLILTAPGPINHQQNNTEDSNNFPLIVVTCKPPHIALLILFILYVTILVIMINGLGIFTIRFPKNFNESKNIAFSTFAVGVVWLAFIPTYFATEGDQQLQEAIFALALFVMAFCIIFCLIVPRLYISLRSKSKMDFPSPSMNAVTKMTVGFKSEESIPL